ncbi:MAG: hypothetical protein RMA76_25960 [Deltaproteobacteria bacterium]|jgi:hypothetical protein
MATKRTTQAQQDGAEKVEAAAEAHIARVEAMFGELEKLQKTNIEQFEMAVDESAKLMKASADYTAKMMDEWRRVALTTSRQAVSAFSSMSTIPFAS